MSERQAASGAAREQQAAPDLAPVGVFDSGVGGLTILRDLLRELPAERYIYFGDTGNCPYGVRTEPEIQALAISAMCLLLDRGAKLIVIACNAASVAALAALRATYPDTPFVGTVPAVKPAAARTRIGRIGVAATEVSAHSDYLKRLVADHANGVEVLAAGCPRLVTLAEAGILDGPEAEAAVRDYIAPMLAAGIDELVLGCTHFPAMRAVFERVAGPGVEVIDSGAAIARRARFVLAEQRRLADSEGGPTDRPRPTDERDEFWCSGDVAQFERVAAAILGSPVTARLAPAMRAAPVERSPLR